MADPDDIWTAALQEAYASAPNDEVILGGLYNDPPVCGEAKDYAMQVCPYLAMPSYAKMKEKVRDTIMAQYVAVDPTMDPNKPDAFAVTRINGTALPLHQLVRRQSTHSGHADGPSL